MHQHRVNASLCLVQDLSMSDLQEAMWRQDMDLQTIPPDTRICPGQLTRIKPRKTNKSLFRSGTRKGTTCCHIKFVTTADVRRMTRHLARDKAVFVSDQTNWQFESSRQLTRQ